MAGSLLGIFLTLASRFRREPYPIHQRLACLVNIGALICLFSLRK